MSRTDRFIFLRNATVLSCKTHWAPRRQTDAAIGFIGPTLGASTFQKTLEHSLLFSAWSRKHFVVFWLSMLLHSVCLYVENSLDALQLMWCSIDRRPISSRCCILLLPLSVKCNAHTRWAPIYLKSQAAAEVNAARFHLYNSLYLWVNLEGRKKQPPSTILNNIKTSEFTEMRNACAQSELITSAGLQRFLIKNY